MHVRMGDRRQSIGHFVKKLDRRDTAFDCRKAQCSSLIVDESGDRLRRCISKIDIVIGALGREGFEVAAIAAERDV